MCDGSRLLFALVDKRRERYLIADRLTGGQIDLEATEFADLMRLHLCDYLEQVERSESWDYRRKEVSIMSERVGGPALQSYSSTFDRESQSA